MPPKHILQKKSQEMNNSMAGRLRGWYGTYLTRHSLRARLAVGITLPLVLILAMLSANHFSRERQLLQAQVQLAAEQLAAVTLGSLRHGMLLNDEGMLVTTLADIEKLDNLERVQIIDNKGVVWASTDPLARGTQHLVSESECEACHQAGNTLGALTSALIGSNGLLRTALPIPNEPACARCHTAAGSHLGVLLVDSSMRDIEQQLQAGLRQDLLFTGGTVLLIALAFSLLVHWLIVRRVEAFRQPVAAFAAGDFGMRLPGTTLRNDELGELATAFNHMADQLERQKKDEAHRMDLREQTIIEERERIARELHDGLSQLLGYVNTKAAAVRLFLKNRQIEAAESQLTQLEAAASEMSVETREAILGLKLAGAAEAGLTANLQEYIAQFCKLCDLKVLLDIAPAVKQRTFPLETELQLLRIVQEALTNVRKHALANEVTVRLAMDAGCLRLEICDNGVGFNTEPLQKNGHKQFGLLIMKERAEAIGAEFSLESSPGYGTHVRVSLEPQER